MSEPHVHLFWVIDGRDHYFAPIPAWSYSEDQLVVGVANCRTARRQFDLTLERRDAVRCRPEPAPDLNREHRLTIFDVVSMPDGDSDRRGAAAEGAARREVWDIHCACISHQNDAPAERPTRDR